MPQLRPTSPPTLNAPGPDAPGLNAEPQRTWPWQRLSVSIIAAMLLTTLIMAASVWAVYGSSVRRQFDNMPPEFRAQFERDLGTQAPGGQVAQVLTLPAPNPQAGGPDGAGGAAQSQFGQSQAGQPRSSQPPTLQTGITVQQPPRLNRAERLRRDLLGSLSWAVAISAAVAVLIGALLARLISKPVEEVSKAARLVAGGDLSARASVPFGNLELVNLTRNFNRMALGLETLERERREMIADIAHELRTPLAVVQARLDAFEDGVLEPTGEQMALMSMQIGLLTRLVSDLRTLSLADAGRLPLQVAPLDLSALSLRISQSFASKAQAAGIELHTDLPTDELPVDGDRDRLGQVLVNLLENAVRYTPPGGQVSVTARREGVHACLVVRDSGPGFPVGSEQQVFARFFRADESRGRDSGGSGLGLAIVAALVRAHGGQVRASNHAQGGAEVEVSLPLAEQSAPPGGEWGVLGLAR